MFYLIYVSSAVRLMKAHELLPLAHQSREKNSRLGITGMLLYQDGSFMQMLEGDKQTVLNLYDTIRKDDRHRGVIKIMTGDVEARSFGDWSMGFCNMNDWASLQKYGDYVTQSLVQRSFQHDAQNARKFMVKFAERAL